MGLGHWGRKGKIISKLSVLGRTTGFKRSLGKDEEEEEEKKVNRFYKVGSKQEPSTGKTAGVFTFKHWGMGKHD